MAFPQLLSFSTGSSPAAATSHTLIYPSGTLAGDLLVAIIASSASTAAIPTPDFFGNSTSTPVNAKLRYSYRYANGSEWSGSSSTVTSSEQQGGSPVNFTTTTTNSDKVSYAILRFPSSSVVNVHSVNTGLNTTTAPAVSFRGGAEVRDYTIVNALSIGTSSAPTAVSTGYTFAASQSGTTTSPTVWIQTKQLTSTANTTDAVGSQTLSSAADIGSILFSVTFASQSNDVYQARFDQDLSTRFQISASSAGSKYVGQTFPGNGSGLSRIGFKFRKSSTGTPSGFLTCSLYLMTGSYAVPVNGYPTGSRLVSSSTFINTANFDSTFWQYEEFVFNPPYATISEQYYVAVVESPNFSGGTVYADSSDGSNNLWTGNAVSSSNGTNWFVGNDLFMILQTVQNSSQYYFQAGFSSQSIQNNKFEGWYSIKPTYERNGSGIRNVSISSASSFDFVSQSIAYDATAGKDVYVGWSIKNDPATSETERAQIGIDFWDDPNQWTEWKSRTRIKLHQDFNYLWQNFTGSIGTGSQGTGVFNGWIDLSETWLQDPTRTGLVPTSDPAGGARWTLNLAKASASLASPAKFFWKLRGELMAPTESKFDTIWPPDPTQAANGDRYNRTVDVPIDEWFWMEWYFKKGSGSVGPNAGRVTIKIETAVSGTQTLFDIQNTTQYVSASTYIPQLMQGSFNPVKAYASSSITNLMSSSGKKYEVRVSDFEFYNLSYPAGSGPVVVSFSGANLILTNFRWVPT